MGYIHIYVAYGYYYVFQSLCHMFGLAILSDYPHQPQKGRKWRKEKDKTTCTPVSFKWLMSDEPIKVSLIKIHPTYLLTATCFVAARSTPHPATLFISLLVVCSTLLHKVLVPYNGTSQTPLVTPVQINK